MANFVVQAGQITTATAFVNESIYDDEKTSALLGMAEGMLQKKAGDFIPCKSRASDPWVDREIVGKSSLDISVSRRVETGEARPQFRLEARQWILFHTGFGAPLRSAEALDGASGSPS